MAIMDMGMAQNRKKIVLASLLLVPSLVFANEWDFEPSIKLNETYSDNINYTSQNRDSTFVTQAILGLKSSYDAQQLAYDIEATSSYATYTHNHEIDTNYLTLNGTIGFQLWPNGIMLIGSAIIDNKPRNSTVNQYSDIISGDTIQNEQYSTGFAYQVDNSQYTIDSNIIYNTVRTEDNIGEQEGYSATLNSTNGINSNYVFWDINNTYRERENNNRTGRSYQSEIKVGYITPYKFNPFIRYYDEDNSGTLNNSQSAESNSYGIGVRWRATPRFMIDLSYNKPISDSLQNDDEQQGNYYDVNLNWNPTSRTKFNAGVSQRFYGDSFNFNLEHRNKRLTNTISYAESVQTFTRENVSVNQTLFWCPIGGSLSINDCFAADTPNIDQSLFVLRPVLAFEIIEDDVFSLNQKLSWLSVLKLSRTTFTLNLARNNRENLSTNIESLSQNANFRISRKISGYSNLDFSIAYTETQNFIDQPQATTSQYRYYKINYNRKFNKTLSIDIGLSHLNRGSNPAIFVYKENRINFEISKVL